MFNILNKIKQISSNFKLLMKGGNKFVLGGREHDREKDKKREWRVKREGWGRERTKLKELNLKMHFHFEFYIK